MLKINLYMVILNRQQVMYWRMYTGFIDFIKATANQSVRQMN